MSQLDAFVGALMNSRKSGQIDHGHKQNSKQKIPGKLGKRKTGKPGPGKHASRHDAAPHQKNW